MTTQADVRRLMEAQGFVEIDTGGGCTAWELATEEGETEILVTDDASHELGESCVVGVYADGEELFSIGVPTECVLREGRHLLAGNKTSPIPVP
jgi:hypothetical protein